MLPRWAYCPVCYKERRYTKDTGVMVQHRMYVNHITIDNPYGYMEPCEGSGQKPIPIRLERSLIHN